MELILSETKTPKPYPNTAILKAFVLGCDPTANDKHKVKKQFDYVFDLGGKDQRYFKGVLDNLKELGLELGNVYIQNLITEVQNQETSKNKEWFKLAEQEIPKRKNEFDKIDPTSNIPVFLTSHHLYKALINPGEKVQKPRELYQSQEIIINAQKNKLGRPLIPLYRHQAYSLKVNAYYKFKIIQSGHF